MADAIKNCMDELKQDKRNTYKFGSVIYRDFSEGVERLTEKLPLQSDENMVVRFLDPIKAFDKYDRDKPEAMYYGLYQCLRQTSIKPEETNFIILVGDAGNHHRNDASQIEQERLVNALVGIDCHLLVFQVHHDTDATYDDFVEQNKEIIYNTAFKKYKNVEENLKGKLLEPQIVKEENSYKLVGGTTVGAVFGLAEGKVLESKVLSKNVSQKILQLNDLIDQQMKMLNDMIENGAQIPVKSLPPSTSISDGGSNNIFSSVLAPGVFKMLNDLKIGTDDLRAMGQEKFQLYIPGAVALTVKGKQYPLFKKVLLMTQFELSELTRNLIILRNSQNQKVDLVSAWKEILKKYVGDLSESELNNMTLEEINNIIYDMHCESKYISTTTLAGIVDLPKDILKKYVDDIKRKSIALEKITSAPWDEYRFSFRSNEQPFFWIDEDLLP
jgi:hypothetical protein